MMTAINKTDLFRPTAILFDWDNTLVDSFQLIVDSVNHALSSLNMETWSREDAQKRIQRSARESLPLVFGDKWGEALNLYRTYYRTYHLEHLKPSDGVLSLLKTLSNLEVSLGIVSNKSGGILREEIGHLGWGSYFLSAIGSGDAERDKPAPDPALMALQEMGIEPGHHVWFVGDAPVDWQCAEAIGCLPIPVGDVHEEAERYPQSVLNCQELEKILREM